MNPFAIIVATDQDLGIGKDGKLPWRIKADLNHFKTVTSQAPYGCENAVVMGRKTWESIPASFRPLPGRKNIVLSRSKECFDGATTASSLDEALAIPAWKTFVIGGGEIYAEAIKRPECMYLYITKIKASFECDVRFPYYEHDFRHLVTMAADVDNPVSYTIERWMRR